MVFFAECQTGNSLKNNLIRQEEERMGYRQNTKSAILYDPFITESTAPI